MRHQLSALASLSRVSSCPRAQTTPLFTQLSQNSLRQHGPRLPYQLRSFAVSSRLTKERPRVREYNNSNARPAEDLNNNITQEEKDHFAKKLQEDKGKQIRTPWHREGSDVPPVARQRSAGAMTKGMSQSQSTSMLNTYTSCRQTPYHPISHAQNHPAPYHEGHEHRPQRH